MTARVAIATCSTRDDWEVSDDPVLADAFARLGVEAPIIPWDDEGVDWALFDAVLIRSTWDYTARIDSFRAWVEAMDRATVLLNPAEILAENYDKLYLERLAYRGVPTVPTRVIRPSSTGRSHLRSGLPSAMPGTREIARASGCTRVAVKPALGAGAVGLLVTDAGDTDGIRDHLTTLLRTGPAIIQPFYESVATRGELSLVYLNGSFSHAVRKVPKPGDIRVQVEYGGAYSLEDPSAAATRVAEAALRHWPAGIMYARVDLLEVEPDDYLLIECELVEPELFFRMLPESADRCASATLARIAERVTRPTSPGRP